MSVMVKVEMFEKVVDVGGVSDRVMSVALICEEDVMRQICGCGLQS